MSGTTSMAARAETLLIRLNQLQVQKDDQAARNVIETLRSRASISRKNLHEIVAVKPELRKLEVNVPSLPAAKKKETATARTALRTTATSIVGVALSDLASRVKGDSVDKALRVAEGLSKTLLSDLNKSVDGERQRILPSDIADPIVAYPGASHVLVVRLQHMQERLREPVVEVATSDLPRRVSELRDLVDSWLKDRPLLEQSLEQHDDELQAFLRRASSEEGVRWTMVTSKVRSWLDEGENASGIRMHLSS